MPRYKQLKCETCFVIESKSIFNLQLSITKNIHLTFAFKLIFLSVFTAHLILPIRVLYATFLPQLIFYFYFILFYFYVFLFYFFPLIFLFPRLVHVFASFHCNDLRAV
jgi:hypothetical protein